MRFLLLLLPLLLTASIAHAQCPVTVLQHGDAANGDELGSALALEGDTAIVGTRLKDAGRGAAYVFMRSGGAWVQTQKLVADDGDPGDEFGYSLALEGDTVVIGALQDGDAHGAGSGSAYVFQRQGGVWAQVQKLTASVGAPQDGFGVSVALEGDWLLIGASGRDAVFVFERSGGSFQPLSPTPTLVPSIPSHGFGWRIELDQSRALVATGAFSDRAHVFEESGGTWTETAILSPGAAHTWWARRIALDGDTAVIASAVAAFGDNRLFVFEHVGGAWSATQEMQPVEPASTLAGGIALDGDDLWVGSPNDPELFNNAGSLLRYVRMAGGFELAGKWVPHGAALNQTNAGRVIAIDGRTALVAAPSSFSNTAPGRVHVLDLPEPDAYAYCFCVAPGTCSNDHASAGCANSTGVGGRLGVCGSSSVALDDASILASNLPPNVFLTFFMGSGQASGPLGDGMRCTSAGTTGQFRFTPQTTDAAGIAQLGPGLVAFSHASFSPAGQIAAGQTWHFQPWYRNQSGPCSSGFNLTNGVRITFGP